MVSAESRTRRIVTAAERCDLVPAMQALGASCSMRRNPRLAMRRIDADNVA